MSKARILLAIAVVGLISTFFVLDLDELLTLANLQAQQQQLAAYVDANLTVAIAIYFAAYVAVAALNIPLAAGATLVAGALFGVVIGTVVVSFASTLGATLAFLVSRFLFRDAIERRFARAVERINAGVSKDGAFYLLTLRLVPLFPFFIINMVMGLTRLRTTTYAWVSQLGMLPVTLIYVNAGTQLGQIGSVGDILSPALLGSLLLLGIFPLLAKRIMTMLANRRLLGRFDKPKRFDVNLVVIGAGSAGLVTSYIAAASKARVVLIERDKMGGDCLNTGCVPSKALIRSARIASYFKRAQEFGLNTGNVQVDFDRVMQRVHDVIGRVEPHDSVERYTELGVECVQGEARIETPYTVRVGDRLITTRSIVIATGGEPVVPPIPGLADIAPLTSDTLWQLDTLPRRLLVLGGGPIGCEMAQALCRLGSAVTLVEKSPRLLIREDPRVSAELVRSFTADGIDLLLEHRAVAFEQRGDQLVARCKRIDGDADEFVEIEFDKVLVAVGRRADTATLGLDELGIALNDNGTIAVNDYLQATYPNIYACGDVAGPYQLTHAAGHQGWYCAMNALFGQFRKFRVDYSVLPWAVFTDPEVAHVGLTESEAVEQGIDCEVTHYGIDDLDRAIADGEAVGFVRIVTPCGRDRILGVTIVGPHAGDLIAEFVLAMRNKLGLKKVLNTIHIYPTLTEANRYAAGAWQKAHVPSLALRIAARLHRWRRGAN